MQNQARSRRLVGIACAIGFVVMPAIVFAGLTAPSSVYINDSSDAKYAGGSISAVRYSSDGFQSIYCAVYALPSSTSIGCGAETSDEHFGYCYLSNPPQSMISAAMGINSSSFLEFDYDSNGYCTALYVVNSSEYLP